MKKIDWKLPLIIIGVLLVCAISAVFSVQSYQNRAYTLEEQVDSAQANVSVQEKRRSELIPNLVDCIKQYDKHEYETLMNVIAARGTSSDSSVKEIQTMINAVSESYPELKSNENYKQLMNELSITENLLAGYRENYNEQVKNYNNYIRKFPARMFLGFLAYQEKDYKRLDYGDMYSEAPKNLFD